MSPYFPAGQLLQFAVPFLSEYVPREHGLQLADELAPTISENFPSSHLMQLPSEVAPRISEYVATGQGVHWSKIAPTWSEYFPAAHETHAVEAFEWLYFPGGHRMQGEVPRAALYLPRTQWKHSCAYDEGVKPSSQLHAEILILCCGDDVLEGHDKQKDILMFPFVLLYVPAGHGKHSKDPKESLYLPRSHCSHSAIPLGPVYPAMQLQLSKCD